MLKKIVLFICIGLLLTLSVYSDGSSNPQAVVSLPGQIQVNNNVVFSTNGQYGFVATYRRPDGTSDNEVYSFSTSTGQIVDSKQVAFSPTAIARDRFGTMVVAGSAITSSPTAELHIVQTDEQGRFFPDSCVSNISVPMTGFGDFMPSQVAISDLGYGIFSNKANIYVFSTKNTFNHVCGEIINVSEIITPENYRTNNQLINIDFSKNNNTLSVIWRKSNETFSILLYKLALDGTLSPIAVNPANQIVNEVVLPPGEIIAKGSNVAFDDTDSEIYFVSSSTGTIYSYKIYGGGGLVEKKSLSAIC